jgi:hypothetical protein
MPLFEAPPVASQDFTIQTPPPSQKNINLAFHSGKLITNRQEFKYASLVNQKSFTTSADFKSLRYLRAQ